MSTVQPTSTLSPAAASTRGQLNGILFVALFAAVITRLASLPAIGDWASSPLIIGIGADAVYGNALHHGMPDSWAAGVNFSAHKLLRIAVAFFGLRVTACRKSRKSACRDSRCRCWSL